MQRKAVRLHDVIENPSELYSGKGHIEHMYTGRLSRYYYRRFDQALEAAHLDATDSVLQVGGGTGIFTLSLVNYVDTVHFTDIIPDVNFDVVQTLLGEITHDATVHFVSTDATSLAYRDNSFDKVFAMDVLEHIPEEKTAIRELARVLKPNGTLVVSAPIEIGLPLLVREVYRYFNDRRQNSESFSELWDGISKSPTVDMPGHRGYDYRQTLEYVDELFTPTALEFCPLPMLRTLNPTAIFTATNPTL